MAYHRKYLLTYPLYQRIALPNLEIKAWKNGMKRHSHGIRGINEQSYPKPQLCNPYGPPFHLNTIQRPTDNTLFTVKDIQFIICIPYTASQFLFNIIKDMHHAYQKRPRSYGRIANCYARKKVY